MRKNLITVQVNITNDGRGIGCKTSVAGTPLSPQEAILLNCIRQGITGGLNLANQIFSTAGAAAPMESYDGAAAAIAQKICQPDTPTPAATEPGTN